MEKAWCYLGNTMPKTTSLKLPEELKGRVSTVATVAAQTSHAYMVAAIEEKVARDEKRQDFIRSGLESLAHFKATGIVYTHAQVKRYFEQKAAGKNPRWPKPKVIPPSER
jgi:predicted transcriptional regulator